MVKSHMCRIAPLTAEWSPIKLSSNIFLAFYSHYQLWVSNSEPHTFLVSPLSLQSHIPGRPSIILCSNSPHLSQFPSNFQWGEDELKVPLESWIKTKFSRTWKSGNSKVKFTITIWTWQSFRNSVLCTPALITKQ